MCAVTGLRQNENEEVGRRLCVREEMSVEVDQNVSK